jgi:hypothetical protein
MVTCIPYVKDDRYYQRLRVRDKDAKPTLELNKMKFVCRMMHNETASLGPTGSPCVRFISDTKRCASLISYSLEHFTIAQIQALDTMEIMEEIPYRTRGW